MQTGTNQGQYFPQQSCLSQGIPPAPSTDFGDLVDYLNKILSQAVDTNNEFDSAMLRLVGTCSSDTASATSASTISQVPNGMAQILRSKIDALQEVLSNINDNVQRLNRAV